VERAVIDGVFRFSPSQARVVGDHAFDGLVGDASASTIQARIREIDDQREMLARAEGLSADQEVDRRALLGHVQASGFALADQRTPFTEPLYYAGDGSELDVSPYLKRQYAPLDQRLASLRKHLDGYAGYLEAARDNLEVSLPRPNLEIAIEAAAGHVGRLIVDTREPQSNAVCHDVVSTAPNQHGQTP